MGVVSSQGSLNTRSLPSEEDMQSKLLAESSTTLVDSNRYILPSDGVHANEHITKNVFSNATAYNVDRFPDALGLTFAYPDGFPIKVTYFNIENPGLLGRSNPTDVSTGRTHNSHINYLKINNFEIRLEKALDMNYQEDEYHMVVEGDAIVYPGLKPQKGDLFYYLLNDGQWGVMAVKNVQRLSISTGTFHRINFDLQEYLTPARQEYIESSVTTVSYFDKIKFFTQNYTLLKHDSYILLQKLTQLRKEIIDYYFRTYHNELLSSILHPDGYYDPYVVAYLQHKVSVMDHRIRPKQLYARVSYEFDHSLWYPLVKGYRSKLDQVKRTWRMRKFLPNFWAADITSLVGYPFIGIGDKIDENTVELDYMPDDDVAQTSMNYAGLSDAFYLEDTPNMNDFEQLIYGALTSSVDPKVIYALMKDYYKWDSKKAFYDIPLALYLIDHGLFEIKE